MSVEKPSEYVFTWRIKNYSSCYQVKGEFIKSPSFNVENLPDSKWRLWLYPKGQSDLNDDDNFISVFLVWRALNKNLKETVSYTIELADEKDRALTSCHSKNHEFNKEHPNWGWGMFFNVGVLEEKITSNAEDILILRCRIMSDNHQSKQMQLSKSAACTTIEVDRCCVNWCVEMLSRFQYSEKLSFQIFDLYDLEITLRSTDENMQILINFKDDESESSQRLTFVFSLFDKTGCKLESKRACHLYERNETWVFPDFITDELLKRCEVNSSKYEFKLMCEVSVSKKSMSSSIEILEFVTPCSLIPKRNDIPISAMKDNFQKMFMNKTYSDVTIRCKAYDFPAHKFVLSVRSPVFAAMFDQDMLENKTSGVDIADIDGKTLKYFLEFLYTETVNEMNYEMAKNLMLVADKYQVPSLVDECSSFMKFNLSTENVCEVIAIADMVGCEHLKSYALSYIKVNASKILPTSNWTKWIEGNIKLATCILSNLSDAIGTNYKLI